MEIWVSTDRGLSNVRRKALLKRQLKSPFCGLETIMHEGTFFAHSNSFKIAARINPE